MGVKSQRSTLAFLLVSLMILSTISIQLGLSEYSFEIVEEYDENDSDDVTLNLAQKEALERASGRSGAVNWVKTAIPSSSSYNDIYNINGVHFHKLAFSHNPFQHPSHAPNTKSPTARKIPTFSS